MTTNSNQPASNIHIVSNDSNHLNYMKNFLNSIQKAYELDPVLYNIDYDLFSKIANEHHFSLKKITPYFKNLNRIVNFYYSYNNKNDIFNREDFLQLWQHTFKFFQLNNPQTVHSNSHADFMNCISSCFNSYFESYYKVEQKPKEEFTNLLNFLPPINIHNGIISNFHFNLKHCSEEEFMNDFSLIFNKYKEQPNSYSFLRNSLEKSIVDPLIFNKQTSLSIILSLNDHYLSLNPQNPYKFLKLYLKKSISLLNLLHGESSLFHTFYNPSNNSSSENQVSTVSPSLNQRFNTMIAPIIDIFIKNDVSLNFIFKLNHELATQYVKSSLFLRDINSDVISVNEDYHLLLH